MLYLTNEELKNIDGGASIYFISNYIINKISRFTYRFLKSLTR